jgi:sensor domain CHASE-containing protein
MSLGYHDGSREFLTAFARDEVDMEWMSRSDMILLVIAAYVAVMTLVRLMKQRRDVLVADVQKQIKAHRKAAQRQLERNEENRDAA